MAHAVVTGQCLACDNFNVLCYEVLYIFSHWKSVYETIIFVLGLPGQFCNPQYICETCPTSSNSSDINAQCETSNATTKATARTSLASSTRSTFRPTTSKEPQPVTASRSDASRTVIIAVVLPVLIIFLVVAVIIRKRRSGRNNLEAAENVEMSSVQGVQTSIRMQYGY